MTMQEELCVLDVRAYKYAEPNEQQIVEQQRLLAQQFGGKGAWGPSGDVACSSQRREGPRLRPAENHHDDTFLSSEHGPELDDLMQDLLGQELVGCPVAVAVYGEGKPGALPASPEQSTSEASTATEEDCVDLLFHCGNTGPWREWMGLEWHHHHHAHAHEASSHTFLKLNHEAAALAVNSALHHPSC